MRQENRYISRCDRKFFERFASEFHGRVKKLQKMAEKTGYTPPDAYAVALAEALDVNEKCRIVIEYDPAGNKVATYREDFTGEVKTFSEYQNHR